MTEGKTTEGVMDTSVGRPFDPVVETRFVLLGMPTEGRLSKIVVVVIDGIVNPPKREPKFALSLGFESKDDISLPTEDSGRPDGFSALERPVTKLEIGRIGLGVGSDPVRSPTKLDKGPPVSPITLKIDDAGTFVGVFVNCDKREDAAFGS